ncbi:MAG: ribosomal protein large subunit ribosomal protein [Parcubacteria group bacterium]|nr:ribosomal protein large subunit ribosomal protein [Parcubacteria group bacterium]
MQLHTLKAKTKRITSQQVGRGGTRGKTSGKGTKGQNARSGRKKRPELRDFIKRFPKLRGRGVSPFKSYQTKATAINLNVLEAHFNAGETVNIDAIMSKKLIDVKNGKATIIKILGTGTLTKKLTFEGVLVSETAKAAIEKAGGNIK